MGAMSVNPIAVAIPVFFVLIGVELAVARARGRAVYRFRDAVTDLSCGVSSQAFSVLTVTLTFGAYVSAFTHLRLLELPGDHVAVWLGAFIAVDFLYYWWHRASHRVNVLWAAHVVHHQSQDYNLAVALRQALLTGVTSLPFYLPLAIVGVPPEVFALCSALNTLYQFFIHTRLVGRLGPVEWVFNTPSHHRVHHGINPSCIDRNHAGVFIVWDRLFGTFVDEPAEEPVYGTVAAHTSWNPLWANLAWWGHILRLSRGATRWSDKVWAFFAPPEWAPAELGGPKAIPEARRAALELWDSTPFRGATAYVALWFVPTALAITAFIQLGAGLPLSGKLAGVGLFFWTVLTWGGLFEGRPWGLWGEKLRLVALAGTTSALTVIGGLPTWVLAPVVAFLVLSLGGVWWMARGGVGPIADRDPRRPAPARS